MGIYHGLVPYPLPEGSGVEWVENSYFVKELVVLKKPKWNTYGGILADSEGRCFSIFYRDFISLEKVYHKKLEIGDRVEGKWIFHKKGRAFGVLAVEAKILVNTKKVWRKVPIYVKRYLSHAKCPRRRWNPDDLLFTR